MTTRCRAFGNVSGGTARALALAPALVLLAACASLAGAPATGESVTHVSGTLTYRERIALPPTATIRVQLVDVSRADGPATVIGEREFQAAGRQVPIAFEITYDPAKIEGSHTYAVQARIEDDGKLRFINETRYAVITRGAPTSVEMILKAVSGPAPR